jgi:L-ascorbate 6-phosphate lactonase
VCRTSGAPTLNVLKLVPQVIDPWAFKRIDAMFCTHHHPDHCDLYSVKAALKTSNCAFVGPAVTAEKLRGYRVPDERIRRVKPGDRLVLGTTEVECLVNYDTVATMTGAGKPGKPMELEDVAVSFLFKTDGGSILFLGDSLYHNGYAAVGRMHKVDVLIESMGHNAPGATDKMTPYDAIRVAQAVKARLLIPDHYDLWGFCYENPSVLERLAQDIAPELKTVILQVGAKFVFPIDQDIRRYRYPDYAQTYRPEFSWEYGEPAKKVKKEQK